MLTLFDAVTTERSILADAYGGKTLAERMTGRFYTPDVLASDLAARVSDALEVRASRQLLGGEVHICDPFCGDGRLVVALIAEATSRAALKARRWLVTLRDVEQGAATRARKAVEAVSSQMNATITIRVVVGDSLADSSPRKHDAVITNPPWELVKPDVRELAHLSAKGKIDHKARLRALSDSLDRRFPDARGDKAWGGWGTNLARCGLELALESCLPGGVLGIVLPSTIFADQASSTMRRAVLRRGRLIDVAAYPSEARLFDRVDQPVVAATFVAEASDGVDAALRLFSADRTLRACCPLKLSATELAKQGYALPIGFGAEVADLLVPLSNLPRFSDLEGDGYSSLWAGRELDETRISEKTCSGTRHPFIKGRMVRRYRVAENPSSSVLPSFASRFQSSAFERVVWRDVSRSSQRRRMIGSIIPAGWVAGNSLHVAYFRDGDPDRLRALHAVLSSFVLEFQVRSRLATGHMSLGVVRNARIPVLTRPIVNKLAAEARAAAVAGTETCPSLEVAVARAYGLDRDAIAAIIGQFPKLDAADREALLDPTLWGKGRRT